MREARLFKRIPFAGTGTLAVAGTHHPLATVNLSKGGACLRVEEAVWSVIEELPALTGSIALEDGAFDFTARICWSSAGEEAVVFGVAFTQCDRVRLDAAIEKLTMDDEPRMDSFNL